MRQLKPKERHERLLADADKVKIVQHMNSGQEIGVTKISVTLARQCDLFVHFQRLWYMRVAGLDERELPGRVRLLCVDRHREASDLDGPGHAWPPDDPWLGRHWSLPIVVRLPCVARS